MRSPILALLFLLLAVPSAALAQAGRFLMAVGDVVVSRGAQQVPAASGTPVQPGDTIRLGSNSNAQVRMTDESIVSLRQNTIFRIDEYVYNGAIDGREKTVFSLLKGGFRTITGAIGRLHTREKYQVRTATSTIGIRGTHYVVVHCDNDCGEPQKVSVAGLDLAQAGLGTGPGGPSGTFGGVSDGRIDVSNNGANSTLRDFGANEFFRVASANSAPEGLIAPPGFLYDRLSGQARRTGNAGNETPPAGGADNDSRASDLPPPPAPITVVVAQEPLAPAASATAPDTAIVAGFSQPAQAGTAQGGAFAAKTELQLSGTGLSQVLTGATVRGTGDHETVTFASAGSVSEVGGYLTPLEVHWGRWNGGTFVDDSGVTTFSANNQFHYLYGELAPPDVVAAKSGTFSLVDFGGTSVTTSNGGTGSISVPGFQVDFTARTVSASSVGISGGGNNFSFPSFTTPINVVAGQGAFVEVNNLAGTCSGGICSTSTPSVLGMTGVFMGKQGDHLGTSWNARTTSGPAFQAQAVRLFGCSPACP